MHGFFELGRFLEDLGLFRSGMYRLLDRDDEFLDCERVWYM